jgi:hypothetical protein
MPDLFSYVPEEPTKKHMSKNGIGPGKIRREQKESRDSKSPGF